MKLKYKISRIAKNDLSRIWLYTMNRWSPAQADSYYEQLIDGIDTICSVPEIGKSISEIKETHRAFSVKSHLIVYEIKNELILIDRILHQNMDIDTQLNE